MKKANELNRSDTRSNGKIAEIEWMDKSGKGNRSIAVNNKIAFKQNASDLSGTFLDPYEHLFIR